jgi:hypothetical protein
MKMGVNLMNCGLNFLGAVCIVVAFVGCDRGADQQRTGTNPSTPEVTATDDTFQTTDTTPEVDEEPATALPNSQ